MILNDFYHSPFESVLFISDNDKYERIVTTMSIGWREDDHECFDRQA